jgi:Phosphotransferase enzyme family
VAPRARKSWKVQRVEVDEARLRATVEDLLCRRLGRAVAIQSLEREPSPFATLAPADILSVTLAGADRLCLFLKHVGDEESDHPEKNYFGREIRIYEELLSNSELPVPAYYGSAWNPGSKRLELYLEHIDGWNLKHHELEHWFTAGRRLARLHALLAAQRDRLRAADFLLRLDAPYFTGWADSAFSAVAAQSAELAARLAPIHGAYECVATLIAQQPATLVHNDPSPKNVIADVSLDPARICFIDWEMAGVGCGLLDLVHLKYGLDRESDGKLCAAYFAALDGTDLLPRTDDELGVLLAACALHKTMHRLAHCPAWGFGPERMAPFVDEAEAHFRTLDRGALAR